MKEITRKENKTLKVALNDEELMSVGELAGDLGEELAKAQQIIESLKSDLKDAKTNEEGILLRLKKITKILKEKKDYKEIECDVVYDYNASKKFYIYKGEILREDIMTNEERENPILI